MTPFLSSRTASGGPSTCTTSCSVTPGAKSPAPAEQGAVTLPTARQPAIIGRMSVPPILNPAVPTGPRSHMPGTRPACRLGSCQFLPAIPVPLMLLLIFAAGRMTGGAVPLGPMPVPVMRAAFRGVVTLPWVTLALAIPPVATFFVTPVPSPVRPPCVVPFVLVILAAMALRPVSPPTLAPCAGCGTPRLGPFDAPAVLVIFAPTALRPVSPTELAPCAGCVPTPLAWEPSPFFLVWVAPFEPLALIPGPAGEGLTAAPLPVVESFVPIAGLTPGL